MTPLTPAELDMLRHELLNTILRRHGRGDLAEVLREMLNRQAYLESRMTTMEVK